MMYPRLKLLQRLLAHDGTIFVSIDDIEVMNLKLVMDEIFGRDKFMAILIWKSRQNKDNRNITNISIDHEYVLCYGTKLKGCKRDSSRYSNPDNDPRGPWTSANMVGLATEKERPNLHYDLINPKTGINYGKPLKGWRYDRNTMAKLIDENKILWPDSPTGRPRKKQFFADLADNYTGYSSLIGANCYTSNGTKEQLEVFGSSIFAFPKSKSLVSELLEQATDKDSIVLDSFAGSGTTAHAVLDMNAKDGGQRRFAVIVADDSGVHDGIGLLEEVSNDHRQGEFQKRPRGPFGDQIVGSGFQDSRFLPQVIIPSYHTECGENCQVGARSCTPSMILMQKQLDFLGNI